MKDEMNSTYEDLILQSAKKYIDQLQKFSRTKSETARPIIQSLLQTVHLAVEKREKLSAEEIPFSGSMLSDLSLRWRARLINQFSLGLGSHVAPVIFIGTEHAYNPEDTIPYSLEAVGLTILWLCGGKPDITTKISGYPWAHRVPFHIHPNALYRVHETKRGQHTWKVLASIMGKVLDIPPRELLTEYNPGLGGITYQIELSAYPSSLSSAGKPPTPQRVSFMAEALSCMRQSAKAVVFHGKPGIEPWITIRRQLSRCFLGLPSEDELIFQTATSGDGMVNYADHAGRRVIITRALNGAVSNKYRGLVESFIRDSLS